MKKYGLVLAVWAGVFFMAFTVGATAVAAPAAINWRDYDEGLATGKAENKKVLVHFWAEWCDSCKAMARDTFSDKRVIDYLNANFVTVKVNFDKNRQRAARYRVRGVPNTFFLVPDGEILSNLVGYIPADLFFDILRYIDTDSYETMSFETFKSKN